MHTIYDQLLNIIGSLESFPEFAQKELEQRHYRELGKGAERLLGVLGEERVSDWELRHNSNELRGLVRALKTLRDEGKQEIIDEKVMELAHRETIRCSGALVQEYTKDYLIAGPVIPKRFR